MLIEIVDFSKKLEENGIYDLIQEENQKIDKPIFVIPVNKDLTEIEIDKSYFVFKDLIEKEVKGKKNKFLTLDGKKRDVEIKFQNVNEKVSIKTLSGLQNESEWRNVLLNIPNLTNKVFGSGKNIDRVGGISSYNIFIFNVFEDDSIEEKLKKTYETNKSNLKEYIKFADEDLNSKVIALMGIIGSKGLREKISDKIKILFEISEIKSIAIIVKFYNLSFYNKVYKTHLSRKLFAKDDKKIQIKSQNLLCPLCSRKVDETEFIALLDNFNSLNEKKSFLSHHQRKQSYNTAVCQNCAYLIYQFKSFILDKIGMTVFPLFIDTTYQTEEIVFLKKDLSKISFQNIINEISNNHPNEIYDFYLIICRYEGKGKDRKPYIFCFDFISGFTLTYNGKSIFEIEQNFNELFFEYKLRHNYFSKKIDSKNALLDNLLYRYRTQIFDFVYRAKDSIDYNDVSNMYIDTLKRRLRDCYKKDKEAIAISNIKNLKLKFLELNKTLGGSLMQTVERIKESGKVTDLASLSYYIGQMVFYLLNQSKKGQKSHAMVEPFINVANFGTLGIKLEETFNAYKHELSLNWDKLNQKFSEIWSHLYDNQDEIFNRDKKILFYAGYFDENIFFQSTKNENKGEEK